MTVTVRPRGRLTALTAETLDFNRHGIAVRLPAPLTREVTVFLSLAYGTTSIDSLVGVVHNCVRHAHAYRIGIRFRPSSGFQQDREAVQRLLVELDDALTAASELTG